MNPFWLAVIFLLFGSTATAASSESKLPELVLYTYDSFLAQRGLGPEVLPLFEAQCGCRVRALSSGDGGQLLTRLQLDAERKSFWELISEPGSRLSPI